MFNPVRLIKIVFSIFLALLLMLQFLSFPGQFRYMAEQEPENAYLRWPLTILVFFIILAIQIYVISLWQIINSLFGGKDRDRLLRLVNISIIAIAFVWTVIAVGWILLLINADDPGLPVVLTVIECAVTAIGLLYLVFRKYLRQSSNA